MEHVLRHRPQKRLLVRNARSNNPDKARQSASSFHDPLPTPFAAAPPTVSLEREENYCPCFFLTCSAMTCCSLCLSLNTVSLSLKEAANTSRSARQCELLLPLSAT